MSLADIQPTWQGEAKRRPPSPAHGRDIDPRMPMYLQLALPVAPVLRILPVSSTVEGSLFILSHACGVIGGLRCGTEHQLVHCSLALRNLCRPATCREARFSSRSSSRSIPTGDSSNLWSRATWSVPRLSAR